MSEQNQTVSDMDEPLRLVIKATDQKYDDLKIDCNHTWSVLDLKHFLNKEYSFKPEVKSQRLIYSGHMLKDTQLVREVVSSTDKSPHIFHLVYNQTPFLSNNNASNNKTTLNNSNSNSSQSDSNVPPSSMNDRTANSDNNSSQTSQTNMEFASMPSMDQRLEYYRAYNLMMSDYYRDMSQRYAFAGLSGIPLRDEETLFRNMVSRPLATFTFDSTNLNGRNSRIGIIIRRRNSDQQAQRGFIPNLQNIARNFERALEGRDLVQDMFTFFKAILMSSMIMVYSSSNRLLIVTSIGILLYLHQFRRLQQQPRQQQQQQNGEPRPQPQQPGNNAENMNNNNMNIFNNDNNNNVENVNNHLNQNNIPQQEDLSQRSQNGPTLSESDPTQQRQSRFRFIVEVVSSIFTSLIPEPPNVN